MDTWPHADERPVRPVVGAIIFFAFTLLLVAIVGLTVFDLTEDEGAPPQVNWNLTNGDQPLLQHDGGDEVQCDRVSVEGSLGSGQTLCAFFDEELIVSGDAARLMATDGQSGSIELVWHDVETGRSFTLIQWEYDPES